MNRWKLVVVLALVTVVLNSSTALATNYTSPPSLDQIKPGDTLDFGDTTPMFIPASPIGFRTTGDAAIEGGDGVYFATDIWFVYGDPNGTNSGPRGYGVSQTTGVRIDYLRAYTSLYDQPWPSTYWYLKDSKIAEKTNDWTSGEAWVSYLHYTWLAPAVIGFKGTTVHEAVDQDLGWDYFFVTNDSF